MIELDFDRKVASHGSLPRSVHQHFQPGKNWQTLGVETIAGLTVTGWPATIAYGTASMWFDTANDIQAKVESRVKNPTGVSVDYVKILDSIDLVTPVDEGKTHLPPGFTLDSSAQQSCESLAR